jgi:hypothetical protein
MGMKAMSTAAGKFRAIEGLVLLLASGFQHFRL